jgi:hypothetical protein
MTLTVQTAGLSRMDGPLRVGVRMPRHVFGATNSAEVICQLNLTSRFGLPSLGKVQSNPINEP